MKTKTLNEVTEQMAQIAETDTRVARRMEIGAVAHQGDVYIHKVSDDHPRGEAVGTRQVAVGDTIGSRHVVEGRGVQVFCGEKLPEWVDFKDYDCNRACLGPVVVASQAFTLTHPEHAHHRLPKGTYQVTYQIDARTREAVRD